MKVVLDTNVIISGLLFPGGAPDRIVRAALIRRIHHATSPDLLTELRRVFEKKFELPRKKVDELIKLVAESGELAYPTERIDVVRGDPADNRVLECAFTAGADYIITGDERHLLTIKTWKGIRLISPADFVREIDLI
ncbi:MAG: putative toxin-antitoxin system toxin component, PIN family [bacterium]